MHTSCTSVAPALPDGLVFDGERWADVVHRSYGFADHSERGASGSLPLFLSTSPLRGRKLVSAVFNTYATPRFATPEDGESLLRRAVERARQLDVDFLALPCARPIPPVLVDALGLAVREPYVLSLLELGPYEAVAARWDRAFRKHLRRATARAEAAGIRFDHVRDGSVLPAFHRLLVRAYRVQHATLAQPRRLFDQLAKSFFAHGEGDVFTARAADGALVAGLLFLRHGDTVTGCYAAAAPAVREASLDTLLKDRAVRHYCAAGVRLLDLGVTSPAQPGLLFAKSRFRPFSQPLPVYYAAIRAKAVPAFDYATAYPALRRVFRHLPDSAAAGLSSLCARYLN